ncbi:hypothetical protein [Marinobacter sp.]|uniref:hypothetical protein n=1 Tax=Marinobacter sp. TaxID=50741 RepID=UPI0035643695
MSEVGVLARVIHTDQASGRFLVLVTEDQKLAYSHWRPFQLANFPAVRIGQWFYVRLVLDKRDGKTLVVSEVVGNCPSRFSEGGSADATGAAVRPSESLTVGQFLEQVATEDPVTVVSNAVFSSCEIEDLILSGSVVFANCEVTGDFRWLRTRCIGSLWFFNCRFHQHFSLKAAHLDGSALFFGCDFSGAGGISFRGVRACSVFIEFGTRGSDDMLWLNEMSLTGCLALNGSFNAPVQLLARQDEFPVNDSPSLGNVYIGRQSYKAERLTRNSFDSGIQIHGYNVRGNLEVHGSQLASLTFQNTTSANLIVRGCELTQDLKLENIGVVNMNDGISITNTIISRNLRMTGQYLRGPCDLSGTSVGQAWIMELQHPELGTPKVTMERFHAEQAWFEPVSLVYGDKPRRHLARPRAFGVLADEHRQNIDPETRKSLAEAYTRFKNWMGDSGHLREEDCAFFHMRHYKEERLVTRLVLGGMFGWGLRFRNILTSAILLVTLFAIAYGLSGFAPAEALMLSVQSFISSFFGQWPETLATAPLAILVTLESAVGVLFVTVLVGAYIRKLLR